MVNVTARIKIKGNVFEILVDCDKAVAMRKGQKYNVSNVLVTPDIFSDMKKGLRHKESDMIDAFGINDVYKVAEKIIKEGEILLPTEYKNKLREAKLKQIIDFISTSCIDPQKGVPHPPERIRAALEQIGVNVQENKSIEEQVPAILKELQKKLPIKMEVKKILVKVPSEYTGKIYGLLREYMVKEEWLSDGSLSCILNIPAATQMDFFDKLNGATHGNAITQEVKD